MTSIGTQRTTSGIHIEPLVWCSETEFIEIFTVNLTEPITNLKLTPGP